MFGTSRRGRLESGGSRWRRAFTLVEMLIAMALTLILVYAIAEFYAYVGNTVKDGRAMIEMGSLLRVATTRLKADLELVTVPVVPWAEDGSAGGYFTISEGPRSDMDANGNNVADATEDGNTNGVSDFPENNLTTLLGDSDDVIAFTIRSKGEAFSGRHYNFATSSYDTVTSSLAEVIWFTGFSDLNGNGFWTPDEPRFLYRRLLLIRPDLTLAMPTGAGATEIFHHNDISAHFVSGTTWQANQLHELSRRENRFGNAQGPTNFPNSLDLVSDSTVGLTAYTLSGTYFGEDRVLSNLLAFDVRVFDPAAVLRADNTDPDGTVTPGTTTDDAAGTVQPGDPGYLDAITNSPVYPGVGLGAYVDIGYGPGLHAQLVARGVPAANATTILNSTLGASQFDYYTGTFAALQRTYDTWARSYERDGYNQDLLSEGGTPLTDEGTDGFDNVNPATGTADNGVDDPAERETTPPFPVPLRGIQIKIRMYEPSTRQVRQGTVGWDFLQE